MAFANVVMPARVTVPLAAGVPALALPITTVPPVLATADGSFPAELLGPAWGIFDGTGALAVEADSCVSFDFGQEFKTSTYPIEDGGFASYNKVATPFQPRVTLTKGGGPAERAAFQAQINAVIQSLALYTVVTPDAIYPSVSLVRQAFRRTSQNGVTLLSVDLWLEEIRIVAAAGFSNTQSPTSQDPQNGGAVTPSTPTPQQSAAPTKAPGNDPAESTGLASTSGFA
jgi:hypothetical protein